MSALSDSTPARSGVSAVLVLVDQDPAGCEEFRELVRTCGFVVCAELRASRNPHPQHYFRSGKAEELRTCLQRTGARTVLLDTALSPTQERNLERTTGREILDRTDVILEIFARHAHTFETKLQVRRARLERMHTRLKRSWTHLERQRGGIGVRAGPGEAQLESDRRKLRHECRTLDRRLHRVRQSRQLGRTSRRRARIPLVVLVGRTNAGKSTLFNALSGSDALVANQLFATLSTTLRRVCCCGVDLVVADTVGFIRRLPHELINSFHATLEEVRQADLLIQLTDISNPHWRCDEDEVHLVLEELNALEVPRLRVYTKIDLLDNDIGPCAYRTHAGQLDSVYVSAHTGAGMNTMRVAIAERLRGMMQRHTLSLAPEQSALQAELHRRGVVVSERTRTCGGWRMDVAMPGQEWQRLRARYLL